EFPRLVLINLENMRHLAGLPWVRDEPRTLAPNFPLTRVASRETVPDRKPQDLSYRSSHPPNGPAIAVRSGAQPPARSGCRIRPARQTRRIPASGDRARRPAAGPERKF